jgi:hypothetical protein
VSKPDIIDNIQTTMSKDYQPIIGEEIKEQVLQVEENITSQIGTNIELVESTSYSKALSVQRKL